jgi:hypothetical protein
VIEHRAQRVRCPACGGQVRPKCPDEVVASAFGARLQAAITALSVRNRVSRPDVVELAEELFAARISTGSVETILARAADALADPYEDLLARVRAARALNVDETGWRTAGERRARWGAFTKRHASLPSPQIATRIAPGVCSPTPRRSSPPIAGGHTPTCRLPAVSCAGRICSATSPPTPKSRPPRRSSARQALSCVGASSGRGRYSLTPATAAS